MLLARGTDLTCNGYIITSHMLCRGQPDSGENCVVLESGLTHSFVAKLLQQLSLVVRKFCAAVKNAANKATNRCVRNFDAGCHGA